VALRALRRSGVEGDRLFALIYSLAGMLSLTFWVPKAELSDTFGVEGIPMLVFVDAKTGAVITKVHCPPCPRVLALSL
jgi:hypothetical protein